PPSTAVKQNLHEPQQFRREQDKDPRDRQKRQDQKQRGVHDIARGDDTNSANDSRNGDDVEDDFFVRHSAGSTVILSPRQIRPPVATVTATPTPIIDLTA